MTASLVSPCRSSVTLCHCRQARGLLPVLVAAVRPLSGAAAPLRTSCMSSAESQASRAARPWSFKMRLKKEMAWSCGAGASTGASSRMTIRAGLLSSVPKSMPSGLMPTAQTRWSTAFVRACGMAMPCSRPVDMPSSRAITALSASWRSLMSPSSSSSSISSLMAAA